MRAHLAICSHGYLGLITSDSKVAHPYSGDYQDVAWTGIHLTDMGDKKIGDRWMSKTPVVLCHLAHPNTNDIIRRFNEDRRWGDFPADHMQIVGDTKLTNGNINASMKNGTDRWECGSSGWLQVAGTGQG